MKKEKVGFVVLGIFVCFLMIAGVVGSLQKSEYTALRSIEISKPMTEVFPMINDLKNWRLWNPWYSQDKQTLLEYNEEKTAGAGAWVEWESKASAGKGKVAILDVVQGEVFKTRVQKFGFQNLKVNVFFKIKPLTETTTEVLCRIEGKNEGFIDRVMSGFFSTPANLEKQIVEGLQYLKAATEKDAAKVDTKTEDAKEEPAKEGTAE